MIQRADSWHGVAIPPLSPSAATAFETAWILLNNPVAYVTSKGHIDRSRAPRNGHWRDVMALALSVIDEPRDAQDSAILAHITHLRNRWRTAVPGVTFNI